MLRSRHVLRRLSDKDKQDMPQEDRAKEEEAAKKEEEEKEVFWMFETEKNFREELKAPTLLRVEFDNYDVEVIDPRLWLQVPRKIHRRACED